MNLGSIDGIRNPVPGEVFVERPDAVMALRNHSPTTNEGHEDNLDYLYDWYNAAVTDYDPYTRLWSVFTLDGHKRTFHLPRIYIRFYAEDAKYSAKRIAKALEDRRKTEACIRSATDDN